MEKDWIANVADQICTMMQPLGRTLDKAARIHFERNLKQRAPLMAKIIVELLPGQAKGTPDPADQGTAQSANQEAPNGHEHSAGSQSGTGSRSTRSRTGSKRRPAR